MKKDINKANKVAKKSCAKWNKNRLSRHINRMIYRKMAEDYWCSEEHKIRSKMERCDTYPWPYSDPRFADWPECDDEEKYTLVSDQSGFVVKHCTSYCAWKIFEQTGEWPMRTSKERFGAKKWVKFLSEAGYTHVLKDGEPLKEGSHYVGVMSRFDEAGLVVWLERIRNDGKIEYSTYVSKSYAYITTPNRQDITWVEIIKDKIIPAE